MRCYSGLYYYQMSLTVESGNRQKARSEVFKIGKKKKGGTDQPLKNFFMGNITPLYHISMTENNSVGKKCILYDFLTISGF